MFVVKIIAILLLVFCGRVSSKEELNTLDDKYTYTRTGYVADCKDTLSIDYSKRLRSRGIADAIGGVDMLVVEDTSYTDSILKIRKERVLENIADIIAADDSIQALKIHEEFNVYTYEDGSKMIIKWIRCGDSTFKGLITKYDSIGNLKHSELEIERVGGFNFQIKTFRKLLSSRVEIWDKGKLMRTMYDNVNRSIIQGKTPCYLKILEQNETVIIQLDPEKEPLPLIQKDVIDSAEVYDVIKYHWYPHCKKYHETKKAVETNLSFENKSDLSVKNDDNSSSYALPHKYYFIILVCIVVAGALVVYRKRKVGRK